MIKAHCSLLIFSFSMFWPVKATGNPKKNQRKNTGKKLKKNWEERILFFVSLSVFWPLKATGNLKKSKRKHIKKQRKRVKKTCFCFFLSLSLFWPLKATGNPKRNQRKSTDKKQREEYTSTCVCFFCQFFCVLTPESHRKSKEKPTTKHEKPEEKIRKTHVFLSFSSFWPPECQGPWARTVCPCLFCVLVFFCLFVLFFEVLLLFVCFVCFYLIFVFYFWFFVVCSLFLIFSLCFDPWKVMKNHEKLRIARGPGPEVCPCLCSQTL